MKEHDVVRLVRSVRQDDVVVARGTIGTIVSCCLENGCPDVYLVELSNHDPISLLKVVTADTGLLCCDSPKPNTVP